MKRHALVPGVALITAASIALVAASGGGGGRSAQQAKRAITRYELSRRLLGRVAPGLG